MIGTKLGCPICIQLETKEICIDATNGLKYFLLQLKDSMMEAH